MTRTLLLTLFAVLTISFYSCGDNENETTIEPNTPGTPTVRLTNVVFPTLEGMVTTSLSGRVVEENGQPLSGAIIKCLSCESQQSITSDKTGSFSFQAINNKGDQAYITVTYPGKFDGYRRLGLLENRQNYTSIQLSDKKLAGIVNGSSGGTVETAAGARVSLEQNGILDEVGNIHTRDYEVYISWIDPSADNLNEIMMGDLSGIDLDGNLMGLSTFGMLQIELEAMDGSSLNIAGGAHAELSFPVPPELKSMAPATIPLWSYNETHGYWLEESQAQLVGENYVGSVTHFSTWNVDSKFDPIDLCGEINIVTRGTEVGLSFFEIRLDGESFNSVGGWLCEDGSFSFRNIPSGEQLTIEILDYCDEVIETVELGPYNEDTKIDPIVFVVNEGDGLNEVLVQGNAVNCDGESVSNGMVIVVFENITLHYNLGAMGNFIIAVPTCGEFIGTMTITNLDDFSQSVPIQISSINDNYILEDLALCEEYEEFFYLEFQENFNPEFQTALDINPLDIWYEKNENVYLFKGIFRPKFNQPDPTQTDPDLLRNFALAFTQNLQFNQIINGVQEDGPRNFATGFEINGETYEFLFTEIGPLNDQDIPSVIAGSFSGEVHTNHSIRGSFRLKPN